MQRTDPATPSVAPDDRSEGLEFGRYYYAHDCGQPYERNDYWLTFSDGLAEQIINTLRPTSVFDAGCALGMLVETLHGRGVEAWGADISEFAIANVGDSVEEYCWRASLTEALSDHYDLITCVEVLEHLPKADTDVAISNLCEAADRILFSSTPYDYGEPTHVNLQPPEYWAAQFARHGFVRNLDIDVSFLTEWAMLFERRPGGLPETVRHYERSLARHQQEVRELRESALRLQGRLERDAADGGEVAELRRELLGTRDALIGAEASLGEAMGKAHALDVELSRYRDAADRLEDVMHSPVWRLYVPYQRARSRFGARARSFLKRLQ